MDHEAYHSIMSEAERSRASGEPRGKVRKAKQQAAAQWLESSRVAERSSAQAEESRKAEGSKRSKEEECHSSTAASEQPTEVVRSYHFCDSSWVKPLGLLRLCPEQFPFGDVSAPMETYTIEPAKTIKCGKETVTSTRTARPTAWTVIEKPVTSRTTTSPTTWITVEKPTTFTKTVSPTLWTTTEVPVTKTVTSTISEYETTVVKETSLTRTVYSPVETVTNIPITETVTMSSTLTETEVVTETLTSTARFTAFDGQRYTRFNGGSEITTCPPAGVRGQFHIWQNDLWHESNYLERFVLIGFVPWVIFILCQVCWVCCCRDCLWLARRAYRDIHRDNSVTSGNGGVKANHDKGAASRNEVDSNIDEAHSNTEAVDVDDVDHIDDVNNKPSTETGTPIGTDSNKGANPSRWSSSSNRGKTNLELPPYFEDYPYLFRRIAPPNSSFPRPGSLREARENTRLADQPSPDSVDKTGPKDLEERDVKQALDKSKSQEDVSDEGESKLSNIEDIMKEHQTEEVVQGEVISERKYAKLSRSPQSSAQEEKRNDYDMGDPPMEAQPIDDPVRSDDEDVAADE